MARNAGHDERQGDLFGAPPPSAKPARRTRPPKIAGEEAQAPDPVSLGTPGAKATRTEIDEFLDALPDQELAYLVVEATRVVKRRLARGQGRVARSRSSGWAQPPLTEALHRLGGELMQIDELDETW
jgi:hypothetical protein